MSRTTRTARSIAAVGVASVASLGVIAAPAHAAEPRVWESAEVNWDIAGQLQGAPGNVHTGQVVVSEGPALDGGTHTSVYIAFNDYQCPDGVTSPDSGECEWLRIASNEGSDTGTALGTDQKLTTAAADTTIVGGWSTPDGWVDAPLTIDLDFAGTGPRTRVIQREQGAQGEWYVVTRLSRGATVTGTVAGINVDGLHAEVRRMSYR